MQRKGHVAGPAAQVEHLRVRALQHLVEEAGSAVPPYPVDVHREHVVQQVIARRDRREHIAHRCGGRCFVSRSGRSGAHDALIRRASRGSERRLVVLGQRYASDNFLISSTAWRIALSDTVLTTSTLPIAVGRTKCGTPLSDKKTVGGVPHFDRRRQNEMRHTANRFLVGEQPPDDTFAVYLN